MDRATGNMASRLLPGGILVIEPWITPESWIVGNAGDRRRSRARSRSSTAETDDFIVISMMIAEPVERGRVVFEHMVGDSGGIHRVSETHEMGWFTHDEYILAFKRAGLIAEFVQPGLTGRGLYFGQKS